MLGLGLLRGTLFFVYLGGSPALSRARGLGLFVEREEKERDLEQISFDDISWSSF